MRRENTKQREARLPIMIVQEIHVEWTKRSRGGKGAVLRNAVPEVAELPGTYPADFANVTFLYHRRVFRESEGFAAPWTDAVVVNPTLRPFVVGCVSVDRRAEGAYAEFRYDQKCGGAPDRSGSRKTLFLTRDRREDQTRNSWKQIVYNGRFAPDWEGDWWYEKTVVNVGLCDPEAIAANVFLDNAPAERFSAMAL